MRKLTTKLAAVVLLLTMMCSLSAFSKVNVPKADLDVHVNCSCASKHVCGLHTGSIYGSWENDPWSSLQERRKITTVCIGCGKTLGSYYEYRYKMDRVMWQFIKMA
ncbi:MAG: hypothetical protein J6U23_11320 [Clostridiales bacterium]|nr:hypothetical protein [Clostridiales bacterium]